MRYPIITPVALSALLALALTPTPVIAQSAANRGSLEDEVRRLDVRYGQRVVRGNPLTNKMEKITYTSSANTPDVHFKMDQAELYCDQLEIFEATATEKRRLEATASAGKRVILYMYERDTMIICDTFTHDLENQLSRLSATEGRQVVSYLYSPSGVMKNTNQWIDIIRRDDGATRITNHHGILEAVQDHRQEGLPTAQQTRLNAFMTEAARQEQARREAAARQAAQTEGASDAPAPAPTESADTGASLEDIDNFYVRYDRCAFDGVAGSDGEETGVLQFQGGIHLVLEEVDMFADHMEILNIGAQGSQSITATADPGEKVVIFAFDASPPILAICDRFIYDPESGTSRLESEGTRANVLSYQVNPNGMIIKSRGEYIAINREGDRTNYSLGSSQGQTLPDPTQETLTPAILKNHLLFFVEEVNRRAAGQPRRSPAAMPYLTEKFGAARPLAPGDVPPTPDAPARRTDPRAPTIQM